MVHFSRYEWTHCTIPLMAERTKPFPHTARDPFCQPLKDHTCIKLEKISSPKHHFPTFQRGRGVKNPKSPKGTHIIQVASDFWCKTALFGIFGGRVSKHHFRENAPKFDEFSHLYTKMMPFFQFDACWKSIEWMYKADRNYSDWCWIFKGVSKNHQNSYFME